MDFQTPSEIAREALQKSRETPQEHFQRLVRLGWINSRGEVTRVFGGDAEPEPSVPKPPDGNGATP